VTVVTPAQLQVLQWSGSSLCLSGAAASTLRDVVIQQGSHTICPAAACAIPSPCDIAHTLLARAQCAFRAFSTSSVHEP
jgi:hypothetical protein